MGKGFSRLAAFGTVIAAYLSTEKSLPFLLVQKIMQWYYLTDNQERKVVDASQLPELAKRGVIRPDTLVWSELLSDWTEAAIAKPNIFFGLPSQPSAVAPLAVQATAVASSTASEVGYGAELPTLACRNHPYVEAVDYCAVCAEPFCSNCLVEIRGQRYCGSCKVMAIKGRPMVEAATLPCKEADEALKFAIIGIFCFGIFLGPIAISKAIKAKEMIRRNPQLTGSGKATAAVIIGILVLVFSVIGIIVQIANA